MQFSIEGKIIIMEECAPDLFAPTHFTREKGWEEARQAAAAFVASLPSVARLTPWVVGSYHTDIFANPRSDSPSHTNGLAVDVSPMYSRTEIMSPTKAALSMAFDMISLATLSLSDYRNNPWAVEGDHVHIQLAGKTTLPPSVVWAVPTLSKWYSRGKAIAMDSRVERAIMRRPTCWTLSPDRGLVPSAVGPSAATTLKEYFSPKTSNKGEHA
jgi:hypothetical protein